MFFPYGTDAPVYYFPWATIGIIVLNVVMFAITGGEPLATDGWELALGEGLHPLQWVSNNFLHADLVHLLGNMVFLWSFGLVVEGKLGWRRFLPLYLGIGVVYSLLVQTAMLGSQAAPPFTVGLAEPPQVHRGALGASGVVFGLMAIALVWAPSNHFNCVLWISRVVFLNVSVLTFAFIYIVIEFGFALFHNFAFNTESLHLTGAAVGAVVGVVMLRRGMVDCEGWDIFEVIRGRAGDVPLEETPAPPPPDPAQEAARRDESLAAIRGFLAAGNAMAALKLSQKLSEQDSEWHLPEAELVAAIKLLHGEKNWAASIEPMAEFVRRFPEKSASVRLKLAQLLLIEPARPFRALAVLEKIPAGSLPAAQEELQRRLVAQAQRLAEDADLELAEDEW